MSMELVQRALAEIHNREVAEITSKAQLAHDKEYGQLSDEHILKQKAERFLGACRRNDESSQRGLIGRLIKGTVEDRIEHYYEHLEADFVTLLEPMSIWGRRLNEGQQIYPETGYRTLPFNKHELLIDDTLLEMSWQVGHVESREIQNPTESAKFIPGLGSSTIEFTFKDGRPQIEDSENKDRPVRIWRVATGQATDGLGIVHREVTHDIDRHTGALKTYAQDLKDDEMKGFSANMFALGILQNAIEFLER